MKTEDYLDSAMLLIKQWNKSDGCTTPFSDWIHRKLTNAKLICMAHDFGSRGLIDGVKPGWHNNVMFFKANWRQGNHKWAVLSFITTLPYALVRYNLGWKIGIAPFYGLLAFLLVVGNLYWYEYEKSKIDHATEIKISKENNYE